jgi:tryptophan synthase alpha chain
VIRVPGDRLASSFAARARPTGLIPYFTAGYPALDTTLELLQAAEPKAIAAELGVPFSDPIADGPDIQRASEWALARGVSAAAVVQLVARFRAGGGTLPIVIMTYVNPILRPGIESFAAAARDAGVDAVLVSDLPPDESPEVWAALDQAGLATVMLVAPTTPADRLPLVVGRARGFVYCLARTGVTGAGGGYAGSIEDRVREVRRCSKLPVAVGFGIGTGSQARALRGVADAVVVGAALMREVAQDPASGVVARVTARVEELAGALAN